MQVTSGNNRPRMHLLVLPCKDGKGFFSFLLLFFFFSNGLEKRLMKLHYLLGENNSSRKGLCLGLLPYSASNPGFGELQFPKDVLVSSTHVLLCAYNPFHQLLSCMLCIEIFPLTK